MGDGVVTVKREATRRSVVANGLERVERDGLELHCLDRLARKPHEKVVIIWNVAGAVTLARTLAQKQLPLFDQSDFSVTSSRLSPTEMSGSFLGMQRSLTDFAIQAEGCVHRWVAHIMRSNLSINYTKIARKWSIVDVSTQR